MCLLMVAWSSCSQAEVADSIEGGNGEAPLEVRAVTGAEVDTRAPAASEMTEGTLGIFRLPKRIIRHWIIFVMTVCRGEIGIRFPR